MSSVLAALDIEKAYGARTLLSKASLTINDGERVGVVGRNGAGKSTFAKILAGDETADGGTVALRRGARVAFLSQEPLLDPNTSVRATVEQGLDAWLVARKHYDHVTTLLEHPEDAVKQGMSVGGGNLAIDSLLDAQLAASAEVERLGGWDRTHEVERVLGHLGILDVIDRPAGQLSGGQRRRVALAQVLVGAPDVMILDEPTNHLDADTIDWLERFLADEFRGAVLFVTHDRWLLDRIADRTVEVDGGSIYAYEGGYAAYLEAKSERLAMEHRTEKNRQNFLRTELEWLRRQPKARGTKQKARIDRAEAAKGAHAPRDEGRVELTAEVSDAGRSMLDVRDFGLKMKSADPSKDDRWLVRHLNLAMTTGERLGVLGPNGSGKTTLLRAILDAFGVEAEGAGPPPPVEKEGTIGLGRRVRIGYLDQERAALDGDLSVYDCVARAVPSVDKERVDPRSYLERFLFDSKSQVKKVAALSGGERARLALARLLASACNLLLLDEPSNDLDTDTLSALEDFLSSYEGSLLVVTHDRYLLDRVTTGILCFEGDGRVTRYAGAYQAYASARQREAEARVTPPTATATSTSTSTTTQSAPPPPKTPGISKNEQRELDGIVDKIDEAEREAVAIEAELGDPTLYANGADPTKAAAVQTRLDAAKQKAAKLTSRWEELEAKKAR